MKSIIHVITPIITEGVRKLDEFEPFERSDLEIRHSLIDTGPGSIESKYDEGLCIPGTIEKAWQAESEGANAIVIDCMGDPGLTACREVVSIPVVGPCQASVYFACMLGYRFGVITVLDRLRPLFYNLMVEYGINSHYASFRAIDVPVLDINNDREKLEQALTSCALAAVREDGVGALILGCTGFLGCAAAMSEGLLAEELDVPVIDPVPLALHVADNLVKNGLRHSKLSYPQPCEKEIRGYLVPFAVQVTAATD